VNLTIDVDTEEEDMEKAPTTPSPNVSEHKSSAEMDTDEEDAILYTGEGQQSDHSSDGFKHI